MAELKPALVECPKCATNIVLLPEELYPGGIENIDPGSIKEASGDIDAVFVIMDAAGRYTCPECHLPGTFKR
jgi:hypothetical protein